MESKFTGGLLGQIGIGIAMALLSLITLGIGTPWAICMQQRWICKHTHIDGMQLTFDGKGGQLWVKMFVWGLLSIITIGIFSLWIPIKYQKWITEHTHHVNRV